MSKVEGAGMWETLADYLRGQARRRLDRHEPSDEGRNARCALALLDAACHVETLPFDDPRLVVLVTAGLFGAYGAGPFQPDAATATLIGDWTGEPQGLLDAMIAASIAATTAT
ncbi:hypothetical protein J5X84_23465 [Streptosporangiaceae bacterium NEAU-GS5]|nr:hypothetical protein [Streptosporangiaceae bacterium NEAU-GS5]